MKVFGVSLTLIITAAVAYSVGAMYPQVFNNAKSALSNMGG
jgi:hypothetical protein